MVVKGGIFDCDGTLLDSMWAWDNIGGRYLESLSVQPKADLRSKVAVMSLFQAAIYMREEYGISNGVEEIMAGMNAMVETPYFNDIQPKPGVPEFLQGMADRGIPMVIATATEKYLIEAALKRLDLRKYFLDVITCNTVKQGKNKPDIYLHCLQRLGTRKEETPVFEDALYCMETAKGAGFPLVGVEDKKTHLFKERALELSDIFVEDWRQWDFAVLDNFAVTK